MIILTEQNVYFFCEKANDRDEMMCISSQHFNDFFDILEKKNPGGCFDGAKIKVFRD